MSVHQHFKAQTTFKSMGVFHCPVPKQDLQDPEAASVTIFKLEKWIFIVGLIP